MWQIDNRTPFAAERTWLQDRDGAKVWVVVVKATFDIRPGGGVSVSNPQPPVTVAPVFRDAASPARSSLEYETDLVLRKTTTDVVAIGHAHAPGGVPVTTVDVAVMVGPVHKRLRVTGDRVWRGGSISSPVPFAQMPVVYERAFGGVDPESRDLAAPRWDVRNPSGTGYAERESALSGVSLPNVEYPDQVVSRWKDRPTPAGFGPLCAYWSPRAGFAGTFDDDWQRRRLPLVPADFDDRYYQCAPRDQQAPRFLQGGEPCALVNLAPTGDVRFALPRMVLQMETSFVTGVRQRHEAPCLHTVILESRGPRVSLVWHSALACHSLAYKLEQTTIVADTSASDSLPVANGPAEETA